MPDFEEIYRLYFADVYRYALALSRDEQTAEEVTQAAFVKALTAIDSFRGELEKDPGDDGIERGFADRDAARRLHRLLHDLPEPYKEVFSLRTFGELPFGQIGELFGKTESWARVTYFRARQKLKEGFDGT